LKDLDVSCPVPIYSLLPFLFLFFLLYFDAEREWIPADFLATRDHPNRIFFIGIEIKFYTHTLLAFFIQKGKVFILGLKVKDTGENCK